MADYKELLTAAVDKAKEAAEASGVKKVYEDGLDRAKSYAKMAKLSAELNREADELKRVYVEIGKVAYEQKHDTPDALFSPLFASIDSINARISSLEQEIAGIKAEISDRVKSRAEKTEE